MKKFTGICLNTRNVPNLTQFYTQVLGVTAEGNDVHAELHTAGAGIAIFSIEGMERMASGSMQNAGSGNVTVMFEVNDVDAEYERLKTLRVEFIMRPTTHPWGARSFWFRDPDGNIIDFFQIQTSFAYENSLSLSTWTELLRYFHSSTPLRVTVMLSGVEAQTIALILSRYLLTMPAP